jgi:carboxymethylenebutenolidase
VAREHHPMRIELPSGTAAELARPEGEPQRGVVLLPDIMGLRPLFDDLAARLAAEHGWAVIEPEPFPGREEVALDERLATMGTFDHARHAADAVAAADALGVAPVAVTGFCMGGMGTLRAAATGRFDRAAAFYGMIRLPSAWAGGRDAIDELLAHPGSAARVLAIVGTADPYTPPEHVAELEAAGATVVRYEGAEHGFVHDASRPTHRADDAADAWRRVLTFLQPD